MGVTRREFVTMLLGATAACGVSGQRTPPGVLVETGMRRGHQMRDAGPLVPARWRSHRVVIVGSGVAGLGAAWALARRGITDVRVLELDDVTGGTARGGTSGVTSYPWGAHYIVAPQREQTELIALLGELGAIESYAADGTPVIDEALRCREPEERVFYRGHWYEGLYLEAGATADDRAQLARFRAAIDELAGRRDAQGRRAFAIPRSHSAQDDDLVALDQLSFGAWLDARHLTSPRLRWLCDYACRDDYDLLAADTSAWAGLFYFAARERAPGAAAQTVLTWPNGNATLVGHLAKAAQIETGVAVHAVTEGGDVIATGPDGVPFGIHAEHVILATPSFIASRLMKRAVPHGDYGAWAVANVHLRSRPREARGAPPAWDSVFRDSPSLGFVSATHQRGRERGPTVWTWYYPFPGDGPTARKQLAGASYADWAEVVMLDLERAYPGIRELIERIEVAFWGHGMIRPRVGTMWSEARAKLAQPIGRVHFAHTDLSGLALFEEAFDHGLRAASEIA